MDSPRAGVASDAGDCFGVRALVGIALWGLGVLAGLWNLNFRGFLSGALNFTNIGALGSCVFGAFTAKMYTLWTAPVKKWCALDTKAIITASLRHCPEHPLEGAGKLIHPRKWLAGFAATSRSAISNFPVDGWHFSGFRLAALPQHSTT